ncbi:MAG: divalent-cation tolerance protein CutA [Candidatus Binataceae bacterium]|jgi:periplasmic divalent cation tolerance protein
MAVASGARLVLVMAANEAEAAVIARTLVEERLAACVNLVAPVRSIYRWHGVIEDATECLLLIKTSARHYPKLERRVKQLHSYEVPEIVAVTFTHGSADYLKWIGEATAVPPARRLPKRSAMARRSTRGRKAPRA